MSTQCRPSRSDEHIARSRSQLGNFPGLVFNIPCITGGGYGSREVVVLVELRSTVQRDDGSDKSH